MGPIAYQDIQGALPEIEDVESYVTDSIRDSLGHTYYFNNEKFNSREYLLQRDRDSWDFAQEIEEDDYTTSLGKAFFEAASIRDYERMCSYLSTSYLIHHDTTCEELIPLFEAGLQNMLTYEYEDKSGNVITVSSDRTTSTEEYKVTAIDIETGSIVSTIERIHIHLVIEDGKWRIDDFSDPPINGLDNVLY